MGAQANLVLNTKTYSPRGSTNGVSKWVLTGDTTFGGASSTATESVRDPSNDSAVTRVRFKLDVPKAASEDSACSCVGAITARGICNIDISIPLTFTAAERADYALRIQGLVASQLFTDAVKDLTGSW